MKMNFVKLTGTGDGATEDGFGVDPTVSDGGPYTGAGGPAAGG